MAKITKSAKTGRIVSRTGADPDTTFETEGPKPKAKKAPTVFKDSRTGEIVTAEYAGLNPGSTFLVGGDPE